MEALHNAANGNPDADPSGNTPAEDTPIEDGIGDGGGDPAEADPVPNPVGVTWYGIGSRHVDIRLFPERSADIQLVVTPEGRRFSQSHWDQFPTMSGSHFARALSDQHVYRLEVPNLLPAKRYTLHLRTLPGGTITTQNFRTKPTQILPAEHMPEIELEARHVETGESTYNLNFPALDYARFSTIIVPKDRLTETRERRINERIWTELTEASPVFLYTQEGSQPAHSKTVTLPHGEYYVMSYGRSKQGVLYFEDAFLPSRFGTPPWCTSVEIEWSYHGEDSPSGYAEGSWLTIKPRCTGNGITRYHYSVVHIGDPEQQPEDIAAGKYRRAFARPHLVFDNPYGTGSFSGKETKVYCENCRPNAALIGDDMKAYVVAENYAGLSLAKHAKFTPTDLSAYQAGQYPYNVYPAPGESTELSVYVDPTVRVSSAQFKVSSEALVLEPKVVYPSQPGSFRLMHEYTVRWNLPGGEYPVHVDIEGRDDYGNPLHGDPLDFTLTTAPDPRRASFNLPQSLDGTAPLAHLSCNLHHSLLGFFKVYDGVRLSTSRHASDGYFGRSVNYDVEYNHLILESADGSMRIEIERPSSSDIYHVARFYAPFIAANPSYLPYASGTCTISNALAYFAWNHPQITELGFEEQQQQALERLGAEPICRTQTRDFDLAYRASCAHAVRDFLRDADYDAFTLPDSAQLVVHHGESSYEPPVSPGGMGTIYLGLPYDWRTWSEIL